MRPPPPPPPSVKDADALDTTALLRWAATRLPPLAAALAAAPGVRVADLRAAATKFAAGQSNPTYKLHITSTAAAAAAAGGGAPAPAIDLTVVVRKKPRGALLPSAHAVEREFAVLAALADTPVPVPAVYALCTDVGVVGTPFYVMAHVDGRVFADPGLPGVPPAERAAMYAAVVAAAAALHALDVGGLGLDARAFPPTPRGGT
ncbi:hypothetical protein BU14_0106s0027 [Porphyra umbilicalis]|uniref:Aminoglycoside phosphotransferase domain-containing protein n=1 Tax=Porphyra umbilicalis TaxID=2786 RepID=A0A1X6PCF6_PORUM|nr:hypothetical protein BU14_0106s0027 [Porphyra umbilicalis]|eukprot:OSX78561.1 hypothetical protein BU14_0106s0027 [Porphyra umbilicalis]